jgi:hypothetical protein
MPESERAASAKKGQTANSVRVEEKKTGATEWSWGFRDADNAAFASGTHLPQQVPTPSSRAMSRMQVAPSATAERMCLSETALHTHTIMARIVNANANDCQYCSRPATPRRAGLRSIILD